MLCVSFVSRYKIRLVTLVLCASLLGCAIDKHRKLSEEIAPGKIVVELGDGDGEFFERFAIVPSEARIWQSQRKSGWEGSQDFWIRLSPAFSSGLADCG